MLTTPAGGVLQVSGTKGRTCVVCRLTPFLASVLIAVLLVAGTSQGAQAQFFPWGGGWQGPPAWKPRPRRRRARRYVEPKNEKATAKIPKPTGALLLVVSLGKQTVTVYDGVKEIAKAPISSGMRGRETPTGVFSILEKNRYHYSNLYGGAPMPFMERITNSGVALHAGHLPGYPASHGCIRLPYSFARNLFGVTKIGARVIVSREDPSPAEFQSAQLMAPLPPASQVRSERSKRYAAAEPASGTKEEFSEILGVRPAYADTSDKRRTREMAAAQRAAEKRELAAAIQVAESGKASADAHVKLTRELARKAKGEIGKARREANKLAHEARKARRTAKAAERKFARLMRKKSKINVKTLDPEALAKESENELAEEAKVLDLMNGARAAKMRAAKQKKEAVPKAVAAAEAAEKVRRAALEDAKKAREALADAKAALAAAETIEARKDYPVSIFVSGKTGRLYAKLGFKKVIDVPVTIAEPDKPLGTHVLTATAYTDGEAAISWNAVTLAPPAPRSHPRRRRRRRHADEEYVAPAGPDADPASALERIQIPPDTVEQLAELMKPGSSFIISDYGLSRETSKRTEFVIEPWRARRVE